MKGMRLTARHSTELITTAVIPRAPVPMAINALIPPAMLDLLSDLSMQHLRIQPSTYGNKAFSFCSRCDFLHMICDTFYVTYPLNLVKLIASVMAHNLWVVTYEKSSKRSYTNFNKAKICNNTDHIQFCL